MACAHSFFSEIEIAPDVAVSVTAAVAPVSAAAVSVVTVSTAIVLVDIVSVTASVMLVSVAAVSGVALLEGCDATEMMINVSRSTAPVIANAMIRPRFDVRVADGVAALARESALRAGSHGCCHGRRGRLFLPSASQTGDFLCPNPLF